MDQTKTAVPAKKSARDRLLAAADELFYEEGFNTVGIDRVIERAGVAKASLYDVFGSKEALIRAYLEGKQEQRRDMIEKGLARFSTPRDRLLGMFDLMAEIATAPGFRGCAFVRAGVEAKPGTSVSSCCCDSRAWLHNLFTDLARDAGAADPATLAKQLVILFDGAGVAVQMDQDAAAVLSARKVAEVMLESSR